MDYKIINNISINILFTPLYDISKTSYSHFAGFTIHYILLYWTKDLLDYQSMCPIISISDVQVHKLFLDSFIFQLLNPILLPSPVLARLVNIFFFHHSNQFLFVTSCFFGWLSHLLFFWNLVKLLLIRVECDSPVFYFLVKHLIHWTFIIIILTCCLLHLGRALVPFLAEKANNHMFKQCKTKSSFYNIAKLSFFSWLSGHLFCLNSVKLFLVCLECDSPIFYFLVKRLIHWTFNIIILTCFLLHLGRVPAPLLTKKSKEQWILNESIESWWIITNGIDHCDISKIVDSIIRVP